MKKRIVVALLLVAVLINSTMIASANEANPSTNIGYYILRDEDGNIIAANMPVAVGDIETYAEDGTYLKKIPLSSSSKQRQDCGYHPQTSIWSNPAWYHFTESQTVSIGFTFIAGSKTYNATLQIAAQTTNTSSITRSYQADQTRQSKIRVYADFNYTIYTGEVRSIYTDELYYTFEFTELVKTGEFFEVVYK